MNRREARERAFLTMFSATFGESVDDAVALAREEDADHAVDDFGEGLLRLYAANAEDIDCQIEIRLKNWSVKRLQKVNLAILRLSVAEMLYGEPDMDSIVINEAVELAKKYGDEEDYQFVNGVLGSISREKAPAGEQPANEEINEV